MRLHEQLGGDEPDQEVESLLADWRRVRADDDGLACPGCERITSDGEYCGECISQKASYYCPEDDDRYYFAEDEGGQG